MTTINEILNAWYTSSEEVVNFGRDLLAGGMFVTTVGVMLPRKDSNEASNMLDYFEKPWYWDLEHAWWVANDWPDDVESWERGNDTGWETT